MAIYLINIALIVFWRLFFSKRRFANSRKIYCGIVAFQWILVSGLRDWSVGADTYAYYYSFEQVKKISWGDLLSDLFGYLFRGLEVKDPGYSVLTKAFQIIFKDYQMFLIAIALLFMVLMARFIYKYSASPCTSFIIFSTLFYSFYAVTGHRQTIATALIVFVGYDLIKQRKLLRFVIISFVAYLIHKSSVVVVPFYFMTLIPVTPTYKRICAVVIALVAILGKWLYGPVALWLGYSEEQIDYAVGGAELFAVLLVALSIVTWAFYPQIKKHREDADFLFHANSLTLLSALLVIQNQGFMRIQQYYSLFIMITVPELINLVKREYRLLAYLAFGAVMIMYLIRNNPEYSFFFMS